jgi:hypothetical protein
MSVLFRNRNQTSRIGVDAEMDETFSGGMNREMLLRIQDGQFAAMLLNRIALLA